MPLAATYPRATLCRRAVTQDDAVAHDARMQFYTVEKIGPKRSLTPEGFLLCEGVPVARTGIMIYGPEETPIEAGPDGRVIVNRDPKEVFRPEFLASLNGKPVVNDHPEDEDGVVPLNFRELTVGVGLNPRQGGHGQEEFLVMDLLIQDAEAIDAVMGDKREISLGYEADYDETQPGYGFQYNLIGNHIALVESGRCGPRCAIGDRKTVHSQGDTAMATKMSKWVDRLRRAIKAKDEGTIDQVLGEIPEGAAGAADEDLPVSASKEGGDTHIHVHAGGAPAAPGHDDDPDVPVGRQAMTDDQIEARFGKLEGQHQQILDAIEELRERAGLGGADDDDDDDERAIEGELEMEAPPGTGDDDRRAHDDDPDDPDRRAHDDDPDDPDRRGAKDRGRGSRDRRFGRGKLGARDSRGRFRDSRELSSAFQDAIAGAEILVPGMRVPTFDAAKRARKTVDAICKLRKSALELAYATPEGRTLIEDQLGGRPLALDRMSCDAIKHAFRGVVSTKKSLNRRGAADRPQTHQLGGMTVSAPVTSLADLNKKNAVHYGGAAK